MLVGIVGAPNKGKSTLFSALTLNEAEIAEYPFTTIKPNLGVAYATRPCAEKALGVKCNPRNSLCVDGTRLIPVNIVDVAGLVPGAHIGKGMGNQFLNDLAAAEALIQVVDVSGKTDINGNPCDLCDPAKDVEMVISELRAWISDIIERHMNVLSKRSDGIEALKEVLSGFGTDGLEIGSAIESARLPSYGINWDRKSIERFAASFLTLNKPLIVAANKLDSGTDDGLKRLTESLADYPVIGCSAAIELALRRAAKKGVIRYIPGEADFTLLKEPDNNQAAALRYMAEYAKERHGTGIRQLINYAAFEINKNIIVYPVESESRYTDHFGNVLPDALLIKKGSTAQELARMIHTDLAERMLYAIDVKKKMRIAKEHVLQDNDIIRIVSAAK